MSKSDKKSTNNNGSNGYTLVITYIDSSGYPRKRRTTVGRCFHTPRIGQKIFLDPVFDKKSGDINCKVGRVKRVEFRQQLNTLEFVVYVTLGVVRKAISRNIMDYHYEPGLPLI